MEPARSIIQALGGPAKAAEITGTKLGSPYRWMAPREKGGCDGNIPHWHVRKILAHAKASGLPLSETDFAPRVEVAA